MYSGTTEHSEPLFTGELGYPCQAGSVYNWGMNDFSETVPRNTTQTVRWHLYFVNANDYSVLYADTWGTADVYVNASVVSIQLPNVTM